MSISAAIIMAVLLILPSPAVAKSNIRTFAECISRSGAIFYGAHWCPHCANQKVDFGKSAHRLPYVECYKDGTRTKLKQCKEIRGFPTWVFADGSKKSGHLSIETLARRTGCPLP